MARTNKPDKNSPAYLASKAKNGRHSLLLIIVFTNINLVMLLLDQDTYFLFSASVPYYTTLLVKAVENGFVDGPWSNGPATMQALVFSFVILTVFFLCWLLSGKRRGWLIAALVLFIVDTLAMILFTYVLYDTPVANLVDLFFHIWAIVELFQAVKARKKLQSLPYPEAEAIPESPTGPEF